jgi:hypothetical protein
MGYPLLKIAVLLVSSAVVYLMVVLSKTSLRPAMCITRFTGQRLTSPLTLL